MHFELANVTSNCAQQKKYTLKLFFMGINSNVFYISFWGFLYRYCKNLLVTIAMKYST